MALNFDSIWWCYYVASLSLVECQKYMQARKLMRNKPQKVFFTHLFLRVPIQKQLPALLRASVTFTLKTKVSNDFLSAGTWLDSETSLVLECWHTDWRYLVACWMFFKNLGSKKTTWNEARVREFKLMSTSPEQNGLERPIFQKSVEEHH